MKITGKDVIWSYVGYLLRFFSGIIVLPLLIKYLTSEELAVWYVFLSIASLSQIFDMGFSPTIIRNVSYAYAGVEKFQSNGIDDMNLLKSPNYVLLGKLKIVSQRIYFIISIILLLLLLTIGVFYIEHITVNNFDDNNSIIIAWIIFSIALFFNMYYSYWLYFLNGLGLIEESQKAVILARIIYFLLILLFYFLDIHLIGLSIAFFVSGVLIRFFSKNYLINKIQIPSVKLKKDEFVGLFKTLLSGAGKIGLVSLGAFLVTQANTILASLFFDLSFVASYGLTLQVINFGYSCAKIPFNTYIPRMNELRIKHKKEDLLNLISKSIVLEWILSFVVAIGIICFGSYIISLMKSNTCLLDHYMLSFMLLYLFLEMNHSSFSWVILTKNEVPFWKASIFSGIATVVLSVFFIRYLELGAWGLLLGQALAQAAYQNWYWPLYVLRDFDTTIVKVFFIGIDGIKRRMFI